MAGVPTRRTTRATARNVDQNAGRQTSRTVTTRKRATDTEAPSKASTSTTANTRKRKALEDNTNAEKKKSNKKGDIGKGKKQAKPETKPKAKKAETRGASSSTSMRMVVEIPIRRRRPSQPKTEAAMATSITSPITDKSTGGMASANGGEAIPVPTTETTAPPQNQGLVDVKEHASPHAQSPAVVTGSPPDITMRSPSSKPDDREGEPPAKRRRSGASDQGDTVARSPTAPAQEQDNPFEIGLGSETVGNELELIAAQPWDDLDAEDENDPLMVAEYVVEIFEYMKELELQTMPSSIYIDSQPELEWHMRGILMDWLIQVHARFKLLPETLFIATNLVDRFLSARVVSLVKLQLVGMTGLLIAAKYEEIMAPAIHDFLRVSDSSYNEAEILTAEKYMLRILDWDLRFPNPMNWLRRASKADEYDTHTRTMAKFLIEISVVEERLLKYVPSVIAAAGLWLSRLILERPEWNANLEHYSGYPEDKLLSCANEMVNFLLRPVQHESLWKKYSSKKYFKCAVYARQWAETRWPPEPGRMSEDLDEEDAEGVEADLVAALPLLREQIASRATQE